MSEQLPAMSSKTMSLLARARRMVPPMLEKFHKGEWAQEVVMGAWKSC